MSRKFIYVRILGQSINEQFKAVSHDVKAYPANTYHVFEMPDGTFLWYNDFGIRCVWIADSESKLN